MTVAVSAVSLEETKNSAQPAAQPAARAAAPVAVADGHVLIPAADQRLSYSDYARISFVDSPLGGNAKIARFDRIFETPQGYQWDNPGVRLKFRTDAKEVIVHLYYNEKHLSTTARNPIGAYAIDGKRDESWTFKTATAAVQRKAERVNVTLKSPAPGAHDYEIILPYGDSVDVVGVSADKSATFEAPSPRPKARCVIYGDSITHGFTAGKVTNCYAFLVAEKKGWQLVDMGIGGRASSPKDGEVVAALGGDVIITLMGANDWQGGVPVEKYKSNMAQFIKNIRGKQPSVPLYFITSLWVHDSWKPAGAKQDLESYRQALREVVAETGDAHIKIVEGPALIDHEQKLFQPGVAVHPNDAGFAMMAERLAKEIQ